MKKHKIARARSGKQKVLLVDDHPVVREGTGRAHQPGARSRRLWRGAKRPGTLRAVASLQPDIVILDLSLPKGHGLELVKDLKDPAPDCAWSSSACTTSPFLRSARCAPGRHGYVMKQERRNGSWSPSAPSSEGIIYQRKRLVHVPAGLFSVGHESRDSLRRALERPGAGIVSTHRPGHQHAQRLPIDWVAALKRLRPTGPHQGKACGSNLPPSWSTRHLLGGKRPRALDAGDAIRVLI